MKGVALILLCAVALGQTDQQQRTSTDKTCVCRDENVAATCALNGAEGELFEHQNCNQFYKCANGQAISFFCPANLVYNQEEKGCDWPVNVECGSRPIVEIAPCPEEEDQETPELTPEPAPEPDSEENGSAPGTCNCKPGEAPGICAVDGSDGTLVANENCNQFYKCANGVPVTISCPAGLVYNPYIECCDWPANVDCGNKTIVEVDGENNDNGNGDNGNGNGNGDSGSGDNGNGDEDNGSNGGTCNCNPGDAPGICAAVGSDGTLVANENCNQFYKCDNGAPVTISCPAGLVYNPYIECCDWPANVDCGNKTIVEVDGGNNGNGNGDNGNGNGNGDSGSGDNGNGDGDNGSNGGTCNCNPGDAPGICAAVGSDGTLVANENCNQFYKCDNGAPVTFSCPAGLVYNPYIECCDWPANVDCGNKTIVEVDGGNNGNGNGDNGNGNGNGESGSGDNGNGNGGNGSNGGTCNCNPGEAPGICAAAGSDGTLVANENCNQFYKCANGVPVTISCPAGLVYNPYIECCDWPANVDCGNKTIVEVDGGNNGNGNGDNGNENGNGDSGSGDNGNGDDDNGSNGGTCNCNPSEAPGICAADGSDGTLIANENCNQFYQCDHGAPVTISCPSGLLYNPYTEVCDWPENVDCGDRSVVEVDGGNNGSGNGDNGSGNGNGSGDSGSGDNDNEVGTCNCNPGEAPGICAADGSSGVLIAHENCNQFYKCDNGKPVAFSCNSGLLYNPYKEQCDWSDRVACGDRPIVEVDGGENNGSNGNDGNDDNNNGNGDNDNGNGDNGSNGGSCNCNPGEAPAICATGDSEGVLIAHEECNKFYKCSFGNPVAFSCPGGLQYNPYLGICDWSWRVECDERIIIEEGTNIEGDNNGAEDQGEQEDKEDVAGQNEGNKDPSQAPTICAAEGSNGVLVAHEECNKFSVCSYGSPVVLDCPSNLKYNPSIEQCDWPMNVDCGDRVMPKPVLPESDSSTCLCYPRQAPSICAGSDSNGKMIAHDSCAHYYVCFNGQPIVRSCPLGLFYEPVSKQCNTAVSCEGREVPSTFSFNKHMEARRGFF